MTIDEEDKMIEWIMADHDAAMAATAVSPHSEEGKVLEHKVIDTLIEPAVCDIRSVKVIQTISHPPNPN
jgi:hypothetical protein